MKYKMMFLKIHIYSKYSMGFTKFTSKNQRIIKKLLNRGQLDDEKVVAKIIQKYLNNKVKTVYLNYTVRLEKFRIINCKRIKRKGIK